MSTSATVSFPGQSPPPVVGPPVPPSTPDSAAGVLPGGSKGVSDPTRTRPRPDPLVEVKSQPGGGSGLPIRTESPPAPALDSLTESLKEVFHNVPHAIEAMVCRQSLFDFVKTFWDIVVDEPPIWNWHIPYLCMELEEVAWRMIARLPKTHDLVINVPPGSTKTTIASVMFPAWLWVAQLPRGKPEYEKRYDAQRRQFHAKENAPLLVTGANTRLITGSYSQDIALKSATLARDIIRSERYRVYFPDVAIRKDQDTKSDYANTKRGSRLSTSVGARVTGAHGHILIIDDPVNPEQALSDTERASANGWMDYTLSTRKISKDVTPLVMIMQRLHEDDCSGHLLARKGDRVRHICLPGEDTFDIKPAGLAEHYKKGLLDPLRLSRAALEEMREDLGAYGYAGQIGQDPRPRAGGLFNQEWFEVVDSAPDDGICARGWDLAATKKDRSAYTAGVRIRRANNGLFYVEDVVRFRGTPGEVESTMLRTAARDGGRTTVDIPQDPGQAGVAQKSHLAKTLSIYEVRFSPETGSKEVRAAPFSSQAEAGNVKLVRGAWNSAFLDELSYFPNGLYADQVDAATRAFTRVNGHGQPTVACVAPRTLPLAPLGG